MFYDVIIIGAGPCGLAAAARLREKTPTALFTNDEHARFWKSHHQAHNSLEQEIKRRKSSVDSGYSSDVERKIRGNDGLPSIAVLDANSDQWMSTWRERFRDLEISHLRSPLFFHPDPSDKDGLLAFAYENGRADELVEIPDVVGKELSKHEKKRLQNGKKRKPKPQHLKLDGRDQIDYYTPSTKLFDDYCDHVVERYGLQHCVQKARVLDVLYDADPPNLDHGLFTIKTESDTSLYSRIVIVATGPSQTPSIPIHQLSAPTNMRGSMNHVFDANATKLPRHVHEKLIKCSEDVNILVVGGGLTSAQLVDLLLRRYRSSTNGRRHNLRIHLLLRHTRPKCKPFDIDLPWVSKTRNHLMSTFWSAETDSDRMSMFQKARNGGSMTAQFAKKLQKYEAEGRLTMHCDTQLTLDNKCIWDDNLKVWSRLNVHDNSPASAESTVQRSLALPNIDHIIYCTGISSPSNAFTAIPFLQSLQREESMATLGPLPILTEDLAWSENIPCFFTGALAALRLGPGAGNLGGARLGAERIAWAVEEILGKKWPSPTRTGKLKRSSSDSSTRKNGHDSSNIDTGNHPADQEETWTAEKVLNKRHSSRNDRDQFTGTFANQFAALATE